MIALNEIAAAIKSTDRFWIAFTGDSITSCEWVHPNWREIVEYVLKEKLINIMDGDWKTSSWGIRCFNFAYDGATTRDILTKVTDVNLVKSDLVISLMGGNDPAFNIPVSEHIENIKKIVQQLNTQVVWCTSTPAANWETKNNEYRPYAKETMKLSVNNLQVVDVFSIYQQFPLNKFFTFKSEENPVEGVKEGDPDLWHPNQLGNAYIAKVILKEVFGVDFDPEKYISDTLAGEKFPGK